MRTILLVEDNFLNRRLCKKALTENGYAVLEAKNAAEALEVLKKEPVTLIILDINLGEHEQDGISLGEQIKEKFSVPFIYLTAYENPKIIGQAVSTSPYSYLTKPFKNSDLIASVDIAIRQSVNEKKYQPSILVKEGEYNVQLAVEDINYIESDGNYLLFHTNDKVYKVRSTIKKIMEELSEISFLQTHRAYIVNKNKISKFNSKAIMIGETAIPVSENYTEILRRLYT
jgi:DNA-binding LytR/AlgR family response regulator